MAQRLGRKLCCPFVSVNFDGFIVEGCALVPPRQFIRNFGRPIKRSVNDEVLGGDGLPNRGLKGPKLRFGWSLGGSWSLSGRLGRVMGLLVVALRRLGCVWERLEGALRDVLGAFWGFLRMSWEGFRRLLGHLGASWGVLERLGGILGSIFLSKGN